MKKTITSITIMVLMLLLVSCSNQEEYTAFAVVYFESNLMGGTTNKILFGNPYSTDGKSSTVYLYSEKKKSIQLQPSKIGNAIMNVDATWDKIKLIESIGLHNVYYNEVSSFLSKQQLINESPIEVFKIVIHQKIGSIIIIDEMHVINISDITAFDFDYKIKELE